MRVPHPLSLHFSLAVPHSWFRGCPSHRPAHPLTTTQPVLVEPIDIYLLSFTSLPVISLPAVCASSRLLGYTCSTISSNSLSISSLRCFELEEKLFSTPWQRLAVLPESFNWLAGSKRPLPLPPATLPGAGRQSGHLASVIGHGAAFA